MRAWVVPCAPWCPRPSAASGGQLPRCPLPSCMVRPGLCAGARLPLAGWAGACVHREVPLLHGDAAYLYTGGVAHGKVHVGTWAGVQAALARCALEGEQAVRHLWQGARHPLGRGAGHYGKVHAPICAGDGRAVARCAVLHEHMHGLLLQGACACHCRWFS